MSSVLALQLVLIRSLLDRARLASREGSDVGLMTAVLLADVGCESLGKAILAEKGAVLGREPSAQQILQALETAVPSLKDKPELQYAARLRAARNPVQHAGQVPSAPSVSRHLADALEFVAVVVRAALGIEFDNVSVAALVVTPDLRHGLEQAVGLLARGDVEDANCWTAAVFLVVRARWEFWAIRAMGNLKPGMEGILPCEIHHLILRTFGGEHPEFATRVYPEDLWREEWTRLSLGFSVPELLRIQPLIERAKRYVDSVQEPEDASKARNPDALEPSEVRFFIEALARQIWRLEGSQSEMLRPTHK